MWTTTNAWLSQNCWTVLNIHASRGGIDGMMLPPTVLLAHPEANDRGSQENNASTRSMDDSHRQVHSISDRHRSSIDRALRIRSVGASSYVGAYHVASEIARSAS